MLSDYINAALEVARYEILPNNKEKFYAEIPLCKGVWATGRTVEECRKELVNTLEGWLIIRLQRKLPIPKIKNYGFRPSRV